MSTTSYYQAMTPEEAEEHLRKVLATHESDKELFNSANQLVIRSGNQLHLLAAARPEIWKKLFPPQKPERVLLGIMRCGCVAAISLDIDESTADLFRQRGYTTEVVSREDGFRRVKERCPHRTGGQ